MFVKFYKVPISYYSVLIRKGSKEAEEWTLKKLNLYPNWKRKLVKFLLKRKLLPIMKIESDADLIYKGNREKLFYFTEGKVVTGKKEEYLVYPTKEIKNEDIIHLFKELIGSYWINLKNRNLKELKEDREKRLPNLNKIKVEDKKVFSSIVHGDFWLGNIEKGLDNELWIFDWGQKGFGTIVEDLVNYFLVEYFSTRKINYELFSELLEIFSREFELSSTKLEGLIYIEIELNKINRTKKQWKTIEKFKNEVENYFRID